jgi:hypothetical protein
LSGCFPDEPVTGPSSTDPQKDSGTSGEVPDLTFIERFTIQLDIRGAAKPNSPLEITARVRGNLGTDLARVQVGLPELEASKLAGAGLHAPLGTPMPPLLRVEEPISAGQEVVHRTKVTIPSPGYYRVAVTASPVRSVPDPTLRVQDIAYVEQWIYVDETRGRITPTLDWSVFGADEYELPGPRRHRTAVVSQGVTASAVNCTWRVKYADDHSVYLPVQDAEIAVSGSRSFILRTNALGQFTLCANPGETLNFKVNLRTPRITIYELTFGQVTGITSATPGRDVIISGPDARVFENMNRTVAEATALFTYTRPSVIVDVAIGITRSFYDSGSDKVHINVVWGPTGVYVAAHEYGHAFHAKGLGGVPSGTCPSSYQWNAPTNMICAWAEGFATFFGVATRRQAVAIDSLVERDWSFPGRNPNGSIARDGSKIEGAVASFLYDLVDDASWPDGYTPAASDGRDDEPVAYGGKYLADVIRTCGVEVRVLAFPSYTWQWTVENAIDYLTYCLESRVDPAVTTNPMYFPDRGSGDPRAERESAFEPMGWDPNWVRNLWVWSLYTKP